MTELIWVGKYKDGKRVAPLRVSLPFQTIETVNESAQQRQRMMDLFSAGRDPDWRNRLIWGDKKYVLPSLLDEFAGKINLIYIDPPFNVGADFSFSATIADHPETEGDEETTFIKEPNAIEMKAYRDTWGKGLDSYLLWFFETVIFLRDLLAENGCIYVHLDHHVSHYAKSILDDIFGVDNYLNELIWLRTTGHSDSNKWNHSHDVIFFYSKTDNYTFIPQYLPYTKEHLDNSFRNIEEGTGRRFSIGDLMAGGTRKGESGKVWRGIDPVERNGHWQYPVSDLDRLDKEGKIYWPSTGRIPRLKRYLDEMPGRPAKSIWDDISLVQGSSLEKTGYDTQKPEALLERIIKASSNESDLVLDCFCGSGTTAAVAEKLNRCWIACDLSRFAIHTTRKRLLAIPGVKPFIVQNLGKYERQVWIESQFTKKNAQQKYREFILDLYHARPINNYTWLHGVKGGRMVHVGSVDAPVTAGDLANIATEFKKAVGTGKDAPQSNGVDVLGWDFAFELNEVAKQQAAQANLDIRFYRIPLDVMDKRAVEQGDIHFFELAALKVDTSGKKLEATLTLSDFVIPLDDVPQEVQKSIKHWSQWVDYWAADWDFKGDTFHNQWQTYRTRKDPTLKLSAQHNYEQAGEYMVVVKVIDILGNDTTKIVKVKVG